MAAEKISLSRFLELARQYPVLDVRSPAEFHHAHIPGAHNLPLFSDEERRELGTLYKKEGREPAVRRGLEFFGPKMKGLVDAALDLVEAARRSELLPANRDLPLEGGRTVLVHCWRGGMRSGAVSWLLDLYGLRVRVLIGGYKVFRREVLNSFARPLKLRILGGFTGSGKTGILNRMEAGGQSVVDLEQLACHKGSAFGDLGEAPAPSQEMFENLLALAIRPWSAGKPDDPWIWMEDESQRIGQVNIPPDLWRQMRQAPLDFLEIPFETRLDQLVSTYGSFPKQSLSEAIGRIRKRLGGADTSLALQYLEEGRFRDCFNILLRYYDKQYLKSLHQREFPDRIRSYSPEEFQEGFPVPGRPEEISRTGLEQSIIKQPI